MRVRARYVLLALLLVPLVDAALLVWVAGRIGAVATVALVVLTGLLGMLLVRAEGRHTIRSLEGKLAAGEVPTGELLDGALLVAAGVALLTPGLVTDAIGFLLVLPPTRYPIRELLRRYVVTPYVDRKTGGFATGAVWTSGFPGPDGGDGRTGGGPGPGSSGGSDGTRTDENDDVVDVDFTVDGEER